jgi:hypothetical protein
MPSSQSFASGRPPEPLRALAKGVHTRDEQVAVEAPGLGGLLDGRDVAAALRCWRRSPKALEHGQRRGGIAADEGEVAAGHAVELD